jgi:multidrug efflux pump subunit AcrB
VAQYPDIVPPQVSVTAIYPGASAAVVEATVAQPLEVQLVGVDRVIYDGSYSLKASFELGTDPDINTVHVNNRVQAVVAQLPGLQLRHDQRARPHQEHIRRRFRHAVWTAGLLDAGLGSRSTG